MTSGPSNLPDRADLDLLDGLSLPADDMASFFNDPSSLDPILDDFTSSWGLQGTETGSSYGGSGYMAHPIPISPFPPSTGPSSPGVGVGESHAQMSDKKPATPKAANRFTAESVRVLRQWLRDHESNPYATAHDVELIQGRTGLTKQQVYNWLSNARRRYKFTTPHGSSRLPRNLPDTTSSEQSPIDIPPRRPTPSPYDNMNPLERWESSPPEHEPASASAISRIVADADASGAATSPATPYYLRSSDVSSSDASSVSSAGFSRSSRGSASSNHAESLTQSLNALNASRKKKRRRVPRHQAARRTNLQQQWHTYQCTFCIETFKHKYDWQRHEKSLHLSLETWVCSPAGPTAVHPDLGREVCVFCGALEPGTAHLETHHCSVCRERDVADRTFSRKDHLRQHLRLVHETNFMAWPMEQWKSTGREIRSRCGFCDVQLETWAVRTDHLAEHFKSGYSMADWKGDWGFDPGILETVDNAIPPYLIHYERSSPQPISVLTGGPYTPTSAYELIKLELDHFTQECLDTRGALPLDSDLQRDGCCVILGADMLSSAPASSAPSWLRDIFLSSGRSREARLLPVQSFTKTRLSQLMINGKESIFDGCGLELELCRLVAMRGGADMSDYQLREEAASILSYAESFSPKPSKFFADFVLRQIWGSGEWIELFRERRRALFNGQQDGELTGGDVALEQHMARRDLAMGLEDHASFSPAVLDMAPEHRNDSPGLPQHPPSASPEATWLQRDVKAPILLNDYRGYTQLASGLARFVTTTMSPNNPNRRVPNDEELQYQARWLWYNEDDPWNQTPADNPAWLAEFKRGVGLAGDGASTGALGATGTNVTRLV